MQALKKECNCKGIRFCKLCQDNSFRKNFKDMVEISEDLDKDADKYGVGVGIDKTEVNV